MKSAENLPAELHYDARLVMNRLGEFYLCIPQPLEIWTENQGPTQSDAVIALDPGVRTFITGYDPSGQAVVIILFCCPSLRHREWLGVENNRFILRLHG